MSRMGRLVTSRYWMWGVPVVSLAVVATAIITAFVADH